MRLLSWSLRQLETNLRYRRLSYAQARTTKLLNLYTTEPRPRACGAWLRPIRVRKPTSKEQQAAATHNAGWQGADAQMRRGGQHGHTRAEQTAAGPSITAYAKR